MSIELNIRDIAFDVPFHEERRVDPIALAGGSAGVLMGMMGMALLPLLIGSGGHIEQSAGAAPFEYIEALLLKHGEVKDDTELPDRIVPPLPTTPEEIIPLDRQEERPEPPPPPPKPEQQRDAVDDDLLRQVFEKARAFAEIQDNYVPEGHPDGVPDGDVTDPTIASAGATYGRRIAQLIRERWIVPTLISDDERNRLHVRINLTFDPDMRIIEVELLRKSENLLFDDSVVNAIELVRKEVRNLPAPPESIASRIYGGGLTITLYGADAPMQ